MTDQVKIETQTHAEAEPEEAFATGGIASFADAESREILNLLGDAESGGACCGGGCCA